MGGRSARVVERVERAGGVSLVRDRRTCMIDSIYGRRAPYHGFDFLICSQSSLPKGM